MLLSNTASRKNADTEHISKIFTDVFLFVLYLTKKHNLSLILTKVRLFLTGPQRPES